jgi:BirA family transcriptional regulator, biotin operon repressor / biotin---[acetyl-CoA-carboxylase] ligase
MSYKVISFQKIPSTQTSAHQMIVKGDAIDRTVIIAEAQSSGRGRYRRTWISHHGNLYASFIYHIEERDPKLSYAVAVAIAETLISFGISPKIKWPNDILIDGKKVSGVLIEYAKDFVIIGIGINIKSNPKVAKYETTKLDNYKEINKSELLSSLMKFLDIWLRRDFTVVRKRWMELAAGLNKIITHRGRSVELIGINEDGALVLRSGAEYIMTYGDEISI